MPSLDLQYLLMELHKRGPSVLYTEGLFAGSNAKPAPPDPTPQVLFWSVMGESGLRVITTATRAELRSFSRRNPVYRLVGRRFIRIVRVSG